MLPAIALAGAGFVGSWLANQSAEDRINSLNDKAMQEFIKINIPDPESQKLAMQRYAVEGKLTPELEQAIAQKPTEFEKIAVDQKTKNAQSRALASLEQIGDQGGLRLQDKAAQQEAMMQGAVRDRGNRLAINDEMNRRGQGGGGFELQSQLQGQQAAGDRDAMIGLKTAASAQDRALQAIESGGELASKYRGQDFQEQSARAQAQDAINQFNARNLQQVQHNNVGYQNDANQWNLTNQQRIADQNVGVSNKEQEYNKGLQQQYFDNQMKKAGAMSGQYGQQASAARAQGDRQANMWSNLGQAGVGIDGAYDNMSEREKDRQAYSKFKGYPS